MDAFFVNAAKELASKSSMAQWGNTKIAAQSQINSCRQL